MDNMQVRKAQLTKLDEFVKTLYDETVVFSKYMNMKDLEMLYLHIHELINEMLQCKNTDEFMAMIEDLHRAIAGVLIIAIPSDASQVMDDMKEAHDGFSGESFEEMLKDLTKSSVQKFGGAKDKRSKHDTQPTEGEEEPEVDNDPEELVDMLDLADHVKKKAKKKPKAKEPEVADELADDDDDTDPMADLYENFK